MNYYGTRFGCRFGQPHDLRILHQNPHIMMEKCNICNKTFRWKKGYKGRVDNKEYLKAHVRQYAQKLGATRRVFMKVYRPNECIIKVT